MIMAPLKGIRVSDVTGQNQVAIDELPSDSTIGEMLEGLVPQMRLPRNDSNGRPLTYHARLEREGRHLNRSERVSEALKESDRLTAITSNLRNIGADVEDKDDGFKLNGQAKLSGNADWATHLDHRLAMTGLIVNLICPGGVRLEETDSIKISYPTFEQDLAKLTRQLKPL